MKAVHLAEVEDVEEGPDTGAIHSVLGIERDELRVEVLLREIASEGGQDAHGENHDSDDPRRSTPITPARHEVLAPQMKNHEYEENLNRPEVEAVEEAANAGHMPPLRPHEAKDDAAEDHPDQGRDCDHAKDVNPGADKIRLPVRK